MILSKEKEIYQLHFSNPIHLPIKFDREYLGKQESQNRDQKVFHKDTFRGFPIIEKQEILMDKIKHTVVQSAASLSDMRAGILKEIREEKRAVWLFGCCECLWAELCKAVF